MVDDTLEGMWIEADIKADNTETIPLFRGYISEATNQTHEEYTAVIRAYDALYKINKTDVTSWYNSLTFPMISCGAVGVMSVIGNALPKEFSKMIRLQMKGEYDPARKIHHRFIDLFSLLFVDGNPAGVKAMLHEMGYIENVLRLPLVPTRISTLQRMSEIMKELKI